jgi:predicted anti-sigma-YlaC factor YlaD
MNHLPFETWMLDDEMLNPEQESALHEHIKSCEHCRSLFYTLEGLQREFKAAQFVSPRPGFTSRWNDNFSRKLAEKQIRKTWRIFGISLSIALLALAVLYVPLLVNLSPGVMLANALYSVTILFVRAHQVGEVVNIMFSGLPPVLPVAIWILAATSFCFICLGWVVAIWKIIIPKGVRS